MYSAGSIFNVLFWLNLYTGFAHSEWIVPDGPYTKSTRSKRQNDGYTCTLPSHPEKGRWHVMQGAGKKPGDQVDLNSVLKYHCDQGYKLSTKNPYLICDKDWNSIEFPECGKLCPPMYSTTTTILNCVDKKGKEIKCHEATDGSYLTYHCIPFYEVPLGHKKTLLCVNGLWNYEKPICQPVCGRKISDDATPLLYGANISKEIEYPWVTAIYTKQGDGYLNICGGSMISRRVVLTAAHCVTNGYGDVLPKENFLVAAGKLYNKYKDSRDPEAQYLEVDRIIVNEAYRGEARRFLADIALLTTKNLFVLTPQVQPVCINDINSIHLHSGNIGELAGWGVKEDGLPSEILRILKIPYKYEITCAQELPRDWADKYNLLDKICAGFYKKNISVCKGDSGSGLVFKNPEDNRYYLHGIVSIGPANKTYCNTQNNSLYTKVAFYYDFIDLETTKNYLEDCRLPPYPENGMWEVENGSDYGPGDIVSSTTVLIFSCKEGYKLSDDNAKVDCESSFAMPTCQLRCPSLNFLHGTVLTCKSSKGISIECSEAVEGSSLKFQCPVGYHVSSGSTNIKHCFNGSWGPGGTECFKDDTVTTSTTTTEKTKTSDSANTKIICTYASWWSYKGVNPEDFDPQLCTHVVYAYIGIWGKGDVRVQDDPLDLDQENIGLYRRVTNMKKKNRNLKFLLSVGGDAASNSSLFTQVSSSAAKIGAFLGSAGHFITTYNFDGLDIHWHYPAVSDKKNYIAFLERIREEFNKHGWLLTATVRSDPENTGYDAPKMNQILDWVTVKTYDMYGSWSAYTGQNSALYHSSKEYEWEKKHLNMDAAANNWLDAGISKNKLVLSIAFFGRSFTLKDENQHGLHAPITGPGVGEDGGGFLRYSEICAKYDNWSSVWDNEQKVPYRYKGNQWYGFDNKDTVWLKAAYIKNRGFFGINVWPVDADDVHGKCGTKQILLKHVHGGLGNTMNWNQ